MEQDQVIGRQENPTAILSMAATKRIDAPRSQKILWYACWGAMAIVAIADCLMPSSAIAGRYGLILGALLMVIAIGLEASFLSRKERALASVIIVLFGAGLIGQRLPTISPRRTDFSAYYVAGKVASERSRATFYYHAVFPDGRINLFGKSEWEEIAQRYGVHRPNAFMYPPFFTLLMRPFVFLSYDAAYALWTGITVILTLSANWFSFHLERKSASPGLILILIVGLFSYYPFFEEIWLGQVGSLIFFFYALGLWLLVRECDLLSGACFAFATMIKVTPVVVVLILVFHRK